MTETELIKKLEGVWENNHPFVVYARPGSDSLTALIQNSGVLFEHGSSKERSFVMAPFLDKQHPSVFIKGDTVHTAVMEADFKKTALGFSTSSESDSKDIHIALVNAALKQLQNGEMEKVVLSRKLSYDQRDTDVFLIYRNLLHAYPGAFRYLWHHPAIGTWVGATPETLLKVKEGALFTMSLAGTQVYEGSMETDWGAKELEEQAMVTRSILEKLSPYARELSSGATTTVKAGKLLHLCTPVKAKLKTSDQDLGEIIKALHPTPAVCGLPRDKARRFIQENENYDRKYYTGYLGPVNMKGETELFVNLRCMELKDDRFNIYVGGGITKDSDPEAEWMETVNKSQTMLSVFRED